MLNTNKSRWGQFGTSPANLISSLANVEEGTGLVYRLENGVQVVDLASGDSDETFAGVAINSAQNYSVGIAIEELTIPSSAPYTLTLESTPLATPVVRLQTGNTTFSYNSGTLSAGEFSFSGKVLTFVAADAGKKIRVLYRRNLTVTESVALYGEVAGLGGDDTGVTGIIRQADYVFTSNYDLSSNWFGSVGPVYVDEGGVFSLDGGAEIPGSAVYAAPTADFPFLGITLR